VESLPGHRAIANVIEEQGSIIDKAHDSRGRELIWEISVLSASGDDFPNQSSHQMLLRL